MHFKELEWEDHMADGKAVSSRCAIKAYGYDIRMEFRIAYDREEGRYCLYSFGGGSIRRLKPDLYGSMEDAKQAAYRIYGNEMAKIKKSVDRLVAEDSY